MILKEIPRNVHLPQVIDGFAPVMIMTGAKVVNEDVMIVSELAGVNRLK
ncbi:hypothetical protein [Treponema denticola]|nr:hypothetical protein [Treponema denticola]UTC86888.1 hypothetical protein E4N79_01480 [Treponema denticola]